MKEERIEKIFEACYKDKEIKDPSLGSKILVFIGLHPKKTPLIQEIVESLRNHVSEEDIKKKIDDLNDKNIIKIINYQDSKFLYYTKQGWRFSIDTRLYQDGKKLRNKYHEVNSSQKLQELYEKERPEVKDYDTQINHENYNKYMKILRQN